METGSVMCFKTTGELALVLGTVEEGIVVRRPVMSHENGITHSKDIVQEFELETVEEHLRREAKEMLLKIQIQDEMAQEVEATKKDKKPLSMVN